MHLLQGKETELEVLSRKLNISEEDKKYLQQQVQVNLSQGAVHIASAEAAKTALFEKAAQLEMAQASLKVNVSMYHHTYVQRDTEWMLSSQSCYMVL